MTINTITINGTANDDVLTGDTTNNVIDGGAGADTMRGGLGDDVYIVDDVGDVVADGLGTAATIMLNSKADGTVGNRSSSLYGLLPDGNHVLFTTGSSNLGSANSDNYGGYFVKNIVTGALIEINSASDGTSGNSYSNGIIAFSPDSTKVFFLSQASNLVEADTNGVSDIFVKDLITGTTNIITASQTGEIANHAYYGYGNVRIFANGTKVLFVSSASNLVGGDTNDVEDVFVKDLVSGKVTLINSASDGTVGNGRYTADNIIYSNLQISPDGSKVLFSSDASNFAVGDTNRAVDYFIKDLNTGKTTLVNSAADGTVGNGYYSQNGQQPMFSADGSKVIFASYASNLVAGDSNGTWDYFAKDVNTGAVTYSYTQSNSILSPDGTKMLFVSSDNNLVAGDTNNQQDVFVRDLSTGEITLVSSAADGTVSNQNSFNPVFSPDGSKVLFYSNASNLLGDNIYYGSTQVFIKDLTSGALMLLDSASDGTVGNNYHFGSTYQFISNTNKVVFSSRSSNLVAGDTNGSYDIFVKDLDTAELTVVTSAVDGTVANSQVSNQYDYYNPFFLPLADGTKIMFISNASNL
ncbi:MAG: PD40 domain-containing protein, partial [Pseudomonadales bacterium]|nr:PD40 domain-containing protein [Pseudomonadales bacterium]